MSDQLTQLNAQLAVGVLLDYIQHDEERRDNHDSLRDSYKQQSIWVGELRDKCAEKDREIEELRKDRDHWKANHDEYVKRNRVLRERPDLPAERLKSYQDLESKISELRDALEERYRDIERWRRECETWKRNYDAAKSYHDMEARLSELRDELDDERSEKELAQAELSRLKSSSRWAVTCEGMTKESAERYAGLMREYLYQGRDNWRAVPFAAKEGGPWVLVRRMAYKMPGTTAASGSPVKAAIYETYEVAKRNNNGDFIPVRLSDVKEDTNG